MDGDQPSDIHPTFSHTTSVVMDSSIKPQEEFQSIVEEKKSAPPLPDRSAEFKEQAIRMTKSSVPAPTRVPPSQPSNSSASSSVRNISPAQVGGSQVSPSALASKASIPAPTRVPPSQPKNPSGSSSVKNISPAQVGGSQVSPSAPASKASTPAPALVTSSQPTNPSGSSSVKNISPAQVGGSQVSPSAPASKASTPAPALVKPSQSTNPNGSSIVRKMEPIQVGASQASPSAPADDVSTPAPASSPPVGNPPKTQKPDEPSGQAANLPNSESVKATNPQKEEADALVGWRSLHKTSVEQMRTFIQDASSVFEWNSGRVERSVLDMYLPGKLTGQWWQSSLILAAISILSWLASKFFFCRWQILVIIIFASTFVYGSNAIALRRTVRDEVIREMMKNPFNVDYETMEWFNIIFQRLWMLNEPMISRMIVTNVEQTIAEYLPSFIPEVRFSSFTLGSKAPRIDGIRTHLATEPDVILMDVDFSYTPNDTLDITGASYCRVNSAVSLRVKVGKGKFMVKLPVSTKDIFVSGQLRIRCKLSEDFPFIKTASVSLLSTPKLSATVRPFDFSLFDVDVFYIPGFNQFLHEQMTTILSPLAIWPNMLDLDLSSLMAGVAPFTPAGVIAIKVSSARRNDYFKSHTNKPSSYVSSSTNGREHGRSPVRANTFTPNFDHTIYAIVSSLNDPLELSLFDPESPTLPFGTTYINTRSLVENGFVSDVQSLLFNAVNQGSIAYDATFSPSLFPKKTLDGNLIEPPATPKGILQLSLGSINNLTDLSTFDKKSQLMYSVSLDSKEIGSKTMKFADSTPTPVNLSAMAYIENRETSKIHITLTKKIKKEADQVIGSIVIPLNKLLAAEGNQSTYPFKEKPSSSVNITSSWISVNVTEEKSAESYLKDLIGVMRISTVKANNCSSSDLGLKKNDPYVRVLVNGSVVARTVHVLNNSNPVWNEVLYAPVLADTEVIELEVMDYEESGHDKSLGYAKVPIKSFKDAANKVGKTEMANRLFGTDEVEALKLVSRKGSSTRATLTINCDFRPCLRFPSDDEPSSKEEQNKLTTAEPVNDKAEISSIISVSEATKYPSGISMMTVKSAELQTEGIELRVFTDNAAFPCLKTGAAGSKTPRWSAFGLSMIRELEYSETTFQLTDGSSKNPKIIVEHTEKTSKLISESLGHVYSVDIQGSNGEVSRVRISMDYLPVPMLLNPVESFINTGLLHFNLYSGKDLPIGDIRSSDPFVSLKTNDKEVYKSKVIKKNLNPVWNEETDVVIQNRALDVFKLVCFDWDVGEAADVLGSHLIDLLALEPNVQSQHELNLDGKRGQISVGMRFEPAWYRRSPELDVSLADNFFSVADKGAKFLVGGIGAAGGFALNGVGSAGGLALNGVGTAGGLALNGVGTAGDLALSGVGAAGGLGGKAVSGFAGTGKNLFKGVTGKGSKASRSNEQGDAMSTQTDSTFGPRLSAGKQEPSKFKLFVTTGSDCPYKLVKVVITDKQGRSYKTRSHKGPSPEWNEHIPVGYNPGDNLHVSLIISNLIGHSKFGEATFSEATVGTFKVPFEGTATSVEMRVEPV
ncbi:tricalbin, C2 domain protein (phospholipid binding) ER-plasma membrane tethering protein Tcb1 [Schizosaccharomyces osmophilus]|uniref:Tricalbin, C2 domain protein (Phospholipid binding) ER-plasma membrane tethering protein Tcb1 n=1 Tax=Schizosaccharomyces osmophilus TaxID=2545709 RepID=A0AAF0AZU4_9SCHI|nr:tricalbin, C2 domain protein (phospholipid binding) ER-plasma membrane tethering protein Tcb1 [Schizosaccharomyces osmophilus]WBW75363.1 tricalbin, C2 domain protein (phospholipid binding) ER-plasma membrane tethering protein Tcb1 [Schizosaccharomyces osmophilus]